MIPRTRIFHCPTTILYQCRNASTRKAKQLPVKNLKTPPSAPKPSALTKIPTTNLANQSWVIEARIPYWHARLRTLKSPLLVVSIVGLAVSSIYFTSSAIPDPSSTPPNPTTTTTTTKEEPTKSLTDIFTLPIKFVLRPILVDDNAREAARDSWRYWAGFAAGFGAIGLFVVSHFAAPRYARYISITPAQTGAAVASASASASGRSSKGRSVMQIYPAFSDRCVSYPINKSTLVSPILAKSDEHRVLRTVRILGPGATLPKLGWGLCMFKEGAFVNGKAFSQQEVVELMERIWVDNGGKIKVAKS